MIRNILLVFCAAASLAAGDFEKWMETQDDKDILRGRERYDRELFLATHEEVTRTNTIITTNAPALPQPLIDGYLATLTALGVYGMDPTAASQHLQQRLAAATNATESAQLLAASAALINYRLEIIRRGVDPDNIGPSMGGVVTHRVVVTEYRERTVAK